MMSLSEVNFIGIEPSRILEDMGYNKDLVLKVNNSMFSRIGRPKLADNKNTIWEIPAFIDLTIGMTNLPLLMYYDLISYRPLE